MVDVGDDRLERDGAVDFRQLAARGDRLGKLVGNVLFSEQYLPLQVAELDEIAIDKPQKAHAGPRQSVGNGAPQRSAAAQQHPPAANATLSLVADAMKQHLPAIA